MEGACCQASIRPPCTLRPAHGQPRLGPRRDLDVALPRPHCGPDALGTRLCVETLFTGVVAVKRGHWAWGLASRGQALGRRHRDTDMHRGTATRGHGEHMPSALPAQEGGRGGSHRPHPGPGSRAPASETGHREHLRHVVMVGPGRSQALRAAGAPAATPSPGLTTPIEPDPAAWDGGLCAPSGLLLSSRLGRGPCSQGLRMRVLPPGTVTATASTAAAPVAPRAGARGREGQWPPGCRGLRH